MVKKATNSKATKKPDDDAQEWATQQIGKDFEQPDTKNIWRAERVKSPEDEEFLALRRYITKKDGTEVRTPMGFMLKRDKHTVKNLEQFASMIEELIEKEKKLTKKKAAKKDEDEE